MLVIAIALCSLIVAAGHLLDEYMLKEEKHNNYRKLVLLEKKLHNSSIRNFHKYATSKTYLFLTAVINTKKPLRSILSIALLSWLSTTLISLTVDFYQDYNHVRLHTYPKYFFNLIFDFITVGLTIPFLKKMMNGNSMTFIFWAISDLLVALFLSMVCFLVLMIFNNALPFNESSHKGHFFSTQYEISEKTTAFLYPSKESVLAIGQAFPRSILNSLREDFQKEESIIPMGTYISSDSVFYNNEYINPQKVEIGLELRYNTPKRIKILSSIAFICLSSFFPSLLYIGILVSMLILHIIIGIAWRFARVTTEKVDLKDGEPDLKTYQPGKHFAILISVLAGLLMITKEIVSWYATNF